MKNIALRKKCPLYHTLDNFLIYTPVVERTLVMKIKLENISPEEALKSIGFKSANRGYVLNRKKETIKNYSDTPVRFHALIELDGTIEIHTDYLINGNQHKSCKKDSRIEMIIKLLKQKDEDVKYPSIKPKYHHKYDFKWGALMVNGKRK